MLLDCQDKKKTTNRNKK